jgi:glycosyltransferase involved in cell wall biosynthesis
MLSQSQPPADVIVVDDGSQDETMTIVMQYRGRVRYIHQENAGGGAARNRGVKEACTPWVAFLDSDDVWTEDHLKRIGQAIAATEGGADLYFDDTTHLEGRKSISRWDLASFSVKGEYFLTDDGTTWMMLENQPMMLQTSVVRRARFLELGGFWEELRTAHDTHFFLRLGIGRPVCAVAGVGAIQTEDDFEANRLTVQSGPVKLGRWLNTARLFNDILDRYPHLDAKHHALLRRRVCEARWVAAMGFLRKGDVARSLREVWRSFCSHPGVFAERVNPVRRLVFEEGKQRRRVG